MHRIAEVDKIVEVDRAKKAWIPKANTKRKASINFN